MVWGCMTSQGPGQLCILKLTVNAETFIEILDHFLIPTMEMFDDDEKIIFQDDNSSCHRAASVRDFLERRIEHTSSPANSPDLNPIEHLWAKLKKLIDQKTQQTKTNSQFLFGKVGWKLMQFTIKR